MNTADSSCAAYAATSSGPTAFEQMGGAPVLRAIIHSFVDAVVSDIMIGFMFQGVHRGRLIELEYQHAAAHLGADVAYRGKPLGAAHAKHRIAGGQFMRRRQLLREALEAHGVAGAICEGWLAYQDSLRPLITADPIGGACHTKAPVGTP